MCLTIFGQGNNQKLNRSHALNEFFLLAFDEIQAADFVLIIFIPFG